MGNIGYLTKEGFRNLRVNKLMTVASITVLFSCLMLIGIAFMLLVNIEAFISGIELWSMPKWTPANMTM